MLSGRAGLFLDRVMTEDLVGQIQPTGADPWFVKFVFAWHGLIGMSETPFTTEKESATFQRRMKRWVQRDYGREWQFYWRVIRDECWKARRKIVLQRGLFKMEPRGPLARTRQRSEATWTAVFDVRQYFIAVTGRPQMRLLGQLVFPNQDEAQFNNEWYRRKDVFKHFDAAARLAQLQMFFRQNHARVLEALRTYVPLYIKASTPP